MFVVCVAASGSGSADAKIPYSGKRTFAKETINEGGWNMSFASTHTCASTFTFTFTFTHIFTACLYNCLALAMCIHSFVCIFYTWHIRYFRLAAFWYDTQRHRATPFQRKTFQFSMMSIAFFKFSTASKRVVLLWCSPLSFGPSHSEPFCCRTPFPRSFGSLSLFNIQSVRVQAPKNVLLSLIFIIQMNLFVSWIMRQCVRVCVCVCRHNIASHIRVYAFEYSKLHTKSHGNAIYERGLNYIF